MIVILKIAGSFWAYIPPQRVRVPFDDGKFYRKFESEQAAIDWVWGEWPE